MPEVAKAVRAVEGVDEAEMVFGNFLDFLLPSRSLSDLAFGLDALLFFSSLIPFATSEACRKPCLGPPKSMNAASIDAAFIDFGGPRHGFLHASDVAKGIKEEKKSKASKPKAKSDSDREGRRKSRKFPNTISASSTPSTALTAFATSGIDPGSVFIRINAVGTQTTTL